MSAAAFHTIGIFEVVLRNALVTALSGRFGPSWYKVAPLDSNGQKDVQRAILPATKRRQDD